MRYRKGLTLIELMVVIVVIGLLAAIAIPNFVGFQTRAKDGRVRSNMSTFAQAMADFAERNNGSYPVDGTSTCLEGGKTLQQLMAGAWPQNPYSSAGLCVQWTAMPYVPGDHPADEAGQCWIWTDGSTLPFVANFVVSGYGKNGTELKEPILNP